MNGDRTARRAELGIDLYRALAVLSMFVVHARRLEEPRVPPHGFAEAADAVLDALMWAEPFTAASFVFIAGYSVVLSHAQHGNLGQRAWTSKILARAALLCALSVALFIPQYGWALPDLVISSGILAVIAVSIALVALLLSSPAPGLSLAAMLVVVLLATAYLDGSGRTVPGLNAGPGGTFPIIAFGAFGALTALVRRRLGPRGLVGLTLGASAPMLLALFSRQPWTTTRTSFYPTHLDQTALSGLFDDTPLAAVPFWNHSAVGALGLLFPLSLTTLVALAVQRKLEQRIATPEHRSATAIAALLLLGRHALLAYVAHLAVLGLLDLTGAVPRSALATWGFILALSAGAILLSWTLERVRPGRSTTPAGQSRSTGAS